MEILNLLSYKLFKNFGFPKKFPMNLTLGVTYRCNSKCQTCYIWKKKKIAEELSLKEFKKIFQKIGKGKLYLLILTGGEPFLHKDFVEICNLAEKYCAPKNIVIPTNGLLGEQIIEKTKQILDNCQKTHITINVSLDGIGEQHDEIRGVKGNFDKVIFTYKKLKELENSKHKNFDVGAHTVVSKLNYTTFPQIYKYVTEKLKPKNYITEIAENREELGNLSAQITPSSKEYASTIDFLIKKLKTKKESSLKQSFRLEYYKLVKEILKQKKQILPCYAGIASAQIDPEGEVWFCCVRGESIGNLRQVNYDLMKLWYNKLAKKQRKSIENKECYCPLASASYTNIALSSIKSLRVVFNFILSRFK